MEAAGRGEAAAVDEAIELFPWLRAAAQAAGRRWRAGRALVLVRGSSRPIHTLPTTCPAAFAATSR
jgi:hypothetical protein